MTSGNGEKHGRPRPKRWWLNGYLVSFVMILGFAALPLGPVLYGQFLESVHGCTTVFHKEIPCMVDGTDIGSKLYQLGGAAYLLVLTVPASVVALLIWVVALAFSGGKGR